jgi:hypothetical protein
MKQKTFSALVRQYFGFLIEEYGYSLTENLYSTQPFGDGIIQLQSNKIIISIMLDREELSILIGPSTEPEIARLSVEIVVDYLTGGKVKSIISGEWHIWSSTSRIEKRLLKYAKALRKYCEHLLRGDLSGWLGIYKYFVKNLQDEYRSMTGEELPEKSFIAYILSKEEEKNQK